jgi:CBS domain-containing protein
MKPISEILDSKGGMVLCVDENEPVIDAIGLMADVNIGAVLVKRNDTLTGIFTERDYLQKIALASLSSRDTPVKDVMSSPVISARPDDTVSHCMEVMTTCRCRHLPIVDGDELLGIVSIGDLVKSIVEEKQSEIDQLNQYIAGSY